MLDPEPDAVANLAVGFAGLTAATGLLVFAQAARRHARYRRSARRVARAFRRYNDPLDRRPGLSAETRARLASPDAPRFVPNPDRLFPRQP